MYSWRSCRVFVVIIFCLTSHDLWSSGLIKDFKESVSYLLLNLIRKRELPLFLSYMMHVKLFSKLAIPFNNLAAVCDSFQQASCTSVSFDPERLKTRI